MENNYALSQEYQAYENSGINCMDFYNHQLVTGSRSQIVKWFSYQNRTFEETHLWAFEKLIFAVRLRRMGTGFFFF